MKRLFAAALSGLLLTGLLTAISACDVAPYCEGGGLVEAETTGFQTDVRTFAPVDSTRSYPDFEATDRDSLAFDRFAISLRAELEKIAAARAPRRPFFQFVTPARACPPSLLVASETVADLRIYSDADFAEGYPAGENLAPLFDVFALDVAREHGIERRDLPAFLESAPRAARQLVLVLDVPPRAARVHRFSVEYRQEGKGLDTYDFTTRAVTVLPE